MQYGVSHKAGRQGRLLSNIGRTERMTGGSRRMNCCIIVLALGLSLISSAQGQRCIASDEAALLEFAQDLSCNDINNPSIPCPIDSWVAGTDCCQWSGVSCDTLGRVKGLFFLPYFKPPFSFQVTSNNGRDPKLFGTALPKLKELQDLDIRFLGLDRQLPKAWGSILKLRRLYIEATSFWGPLPAEFGKLSNLEILHIDTVAPGLFGEGLNGTSGIPRELCKLSKLKTFLLRYHPNLQGGIPTCIDGWRSIESFEIINGAEVAVGRNFELSPGMGGLLPETLGNLTTLKVLHLGGNDFGGWVPRSLGRLTKLTSLNLALNRLTGKIPKEFGQLTNLDSLYLYGNKMFAEIPSTLSNLKVLTKLDLGSNAFYGPIPGGVYNLPKVATLRLDNNRLWGPLPKAEGPRDLSIMLFMNVSFNFLDGPLNARQLPSNLDSFYMATQNGRMAFTSIPSTVSVLKKLRNLDLHENQLTGQIPQTFNDMPLLEFVDLSNNKLDGKVPAKLKQINANLEDNPRLIL